MSQIKFSVIIPTYHRNDLLAKCLNCLAPGVQTLPANQYEVIVSDDGFKTTAEEMVQQHYPWVKWVAGPRKGPAANRNHGAKYAEGEWLAFTDDDCLPDPQWLAAYAELIISKASCSILEGRVYVDRPQKSLAEQSPINEVGGYLWSCNFAIERQVFESLQGFDERFPYAAMEDVDFKFRINEANYPIYFVRNAAICHPWRRQNGWKQFKQHQESTFIYLSIHPEELNRINSVFYLRHALVSFVKQTIPLAIKFKFSGFDYSLMHHFTSLQMFFQLAFNKRN
ncbi:MAG: glycosyltransferase [Goleter apudmare HA4340-LM2]|jgi:GT2 family glycosyltransferase|nr:glycosyltransferase [Goleter apudmare HA4340-LM2]